MAHYVLALLLVTTSAFAQRADVKAQVIKESQRLSSIIDRSLNSLSPAELRRVNQVLKAAIDETNLIVTGSIGQPGNPGPRTTPVPYPTPRHTRAPRAGRLECKWMDGNSGGISGRGYHLLSQPRGLYYSEKFYGNNSVESYRNCMADALIDLVTDYEIDSARSTTCACTWFTGTNHEEPLERGYHMNYEVRVPTLRGEISHVISSGFFGNNSTQSKESCQRQLIENGFVCQ